MKFDAQGVHLWTRQRGGEGSDYAWALEADGVRLRFRIFSMEEKHGKTLDPLARSMLDAPALSQVEWHHIQMDQSFGCPYKV